LSEDFSSKYLKTPFNYGIVVTSNNKGKIMSNKRKYSKGDSVNYCGKRWIVCEGGESSPDTKSYKYKIARGAWKRKVAGNCLTECAI